MMKKTQNKLAAETMFKEPQADEEQATPATESETPAAGSTFKPGVVYIGVLDGPKLTKGWFSNEPLLSADRQWRVVGETDSVNKAIGKMLSDFYFWFSAPAEGADSIEAHFRDTVLRLALANQK